MIRQAIGHAWVALALLFVAGVLTDRLAITTIRLWTLRETRRAERIAREWAQRDAVRNGNVQLVHPDRRDTAS